MIIALAITVKQVPADEFADRMSISLTLLLTSIAFKFYLSEKLPKVLPTSARAIGIVSLKVLPTRARAVIGRSACAPGDDALRVVARAVRCGSCLLQISYLTLLDRYILCGLFVQFVFIVENVLGHFLPDSDDVLLRVLLVLIGVYFVWFACEGALLTFYVHGDQMLRSGNSVNDSAFMRQLEESQQGNSGKVAPANVHEKLSQLNRVWCSVFNGNPDGASRVSGLVWKDVGSITPSDVESWDVPLEGCATEDKFKNLREALSDKHYEQHEKWKSAASALLRFDQTEFGEFEAEFTQNGLKVWPEFHSEGDEALKEARREYDEEKYARGIRKLHELHAVQVKMGISGKASSGYHYFMPVAQERAPEDFYTTKVYKSYSQWFRSGTDAGFATKPADVAAEPRARNASDYAINRPLTSPRPSELSITPKRRISWSADHEEETDTGAGIGVGFQLDPLPARK
jgi:hypothetical protein